MRFALLCVFVFYCVPAWAGDLESLAEHPRWRALLHINPGATLRDRHRSYVDDDTFFLAAEGADDPLAELRATRRVLQPAGAPDRCRFPARYRFLAEQLNWHDPEPFAHCDEYREWRAAVHAKRAVLVFPASYLNSPSSMFGHTLMRLDQGEDGAVWLSWAINFGAVTSEQDNSLFYIYRGLAGGYPGRFNLVPYVQKIQQYSNMESRDIWEYSLNLNQQEIDWMIDHLWELKDINFDYYFFDENCSFRLLELVQVARPRSGLLDELRFAELPVNTVRALEQEGLVSERHYRPSKEQEMKAFSDQLDATERVLARRLADDPSVADEAAFLAQPEQRQALMARTAYRYVRFINRKAQRSDDVAGRSFALLSLINRLPTVPAPHPPTRTPPEQGHGSQMLAVAGGQHGAADFGEISYRLTYHDLIDNSHGFLSGAQIQGLGLTLRSTESQAVDLETLDVISIRSLAPRDRFSKPLSWYVEGGLERAWAGRRRLVRYVHGGAGASWRLGAWQPYVLASARAENNSDFAPWITTGGGAEAGILYHAGRWQWQAGGVGHYFTNDVYRHRSTLAVQYALTRQQGLRAELEREGWRGDGDTEFKLQWRWYFD